MEQEALSGNNVTLTALLVALLAGTQGVSFLVKNWHNRLYQAFAALCGAAMIANVGLAFATVNQSRGWHVIHLLGSIWAGPTTVYFFLELLGKPQPRGAFLRPLMIPVGIALSLVVLTGFHPALSAADVLPASLPELMADELHRMGNLAHGQWWEQIPLATLFASTVISQPYRYGIALLTGLYMFTCFGCVFLNVLDRRSRTRTRIERTRLTWLARLGMITIVGSLLQSTGYYFQLPIGSYPVGCLAQLAFLSFLTQVISVFRLLDLHEMLSRGMVFLSQVVIISSLYSFLLVLFGDQRSWVNLGITIFLASGVVFALHSSVRQRIEKTFHRLFFLRRYELMVRLNALDRELPRLLTVDALFDTLIAGLRATPQISNVAIFLWDERSRDYACVRRTGPDGWPRALKVSASSGLARELLRRSGPIGEEELEREVEWQKERRTDPVSTLATLKKLDAQIVIPFVSSGVLFGFMLIKDDSLHEGFTQDELELLQHLADRGTVIIQNSDAIQRLKERDRLAALGQMAAGLAHEIRNPLGAIRGAAEYIAESSEDSPDSEFLDIIIEEVDRLNRVVTDFLDYSRPLKIQLEPCDLNRLVTQVANMLSAQALLGGVHFQLELSPQLPMVSADMEKLKQVLLNLLQNALQAMPQGGEVVLKTAGVHHVSWPELVPGETPLEWVQVEVSDHGVGIPPEELEKLFIPFFTTKAGGTGLGLAISQRLVQSHGGELEASSVMGQGSTFTLRLPAIAPPLVSGLARLPALTEATLTSGDASVIASTRSNAGAAAP